MTRHFLLLLTLLVTVTSCRTSYVAHGPQGGIATTLRLPKGFDPQRDTLDAVVILHGIFSSKSYPPIPKMARALTRQGVATLTMDFGGHGKSQGKKINMTIEKEIAEARAVYDYVRSLPYVNQVTLLGHSQGGVVASMLAGRLASEGHEPDKLVLLAPGAVIKDACRGGHFFGNTFDPKYPPHHIKCYGLFKVGREYLTTTQNLDIYGTSAQYQGPVCILHGTNDKMVPLWCSKRYDTIYKNSILHLIQGEVHTMNKKLSETTSIIQQFVEQ